MTTSYHKKVKQEVKQKLEKITYYEACESGFIAHNDKECPYVANIGDTISGGSNKYMELANFSEKPVMLKPGYNTVRNGWAQHIVCPPRSNIRMNYGGSPHDFAQYVIEELHEVEETPLFYFKSRVNFRGGV